MIIGLAGYSGSGKDYTAARFPDRYVNKKFAKPLKDMIRALLVAQDVPESMIEEYIEGYLKEDPTPYFEGASPRFAMQTLGTQWGRECISPDFWANIALRGANQNIVVSDCRFTNEVDRVIARGGVVVWIENPSVARRSEHSSENPPKVNFRLVNSVGTPVQEYTRAVHRMVWWLEKYWAVTKCYCPLYDIQDAPVFCPSRACLIAAVDYEGEL